jgi:hypothetical protein
MYRAILFFWPSVRAGSLAAVKEIDAPAGLERIRLWRAFPGALYDAQIQAQNKKPQTQVMSHGTSVDQPSPKCCSKTD